MRFAVATLSAAALGLALANGAYADTRNSSDKATMERKASPAAPKSDEERAEASQGQPNVPHGSSAGSSAPGGSDKEQAFKRLDLDGDGSISKAEAAGNAKLMNAFDGADTDRDGKLSRAEYDGMGSKPEAKAKTKTSQRAKAQAK